RPRPDPRRDARPLPRRRPGQLADHLLPPGGRAGASPATRLRQPGGCGGVAAAVREGSRGRHNGVRGAAGGGRHPLLVPGRRRGGGQARCGGRSTMTDFSQLPKHPNAYSELPTEIPCPWCQKYAYDQRTYTLLTLVFIGFWAYARADDVTL